MIKTIQFMILKLHRALVVLFNSFKELIIGLRFMFAFLLFLFLSFYIIRVNTETSQTDLIKEGDFNLSDLKSDVSKINVE